MKKPRENRTADPRAQDPWLPKEPGRHRWVAMVVYPLTDQQAAALNDGAVVNLGNRVDSVIGCYDCDKTYQGDHDKPCTAEAKAT